MAVACVLVLAAVLIIEILTPGPVVAIPFALLPMAVGVWLLSARFAVPLLGFTALLFVVDAVIEDENRATLLMMAIPVVALGALARLSASHIRHAIAAPQASGDETPPSIGALTPRELEVARLAASAYTAAQIAQRLHIGERTVESHIASAYLKLGIASRSELIRMAERLR